MKSYLQVQSFDGNTVSSQSNIIFDTVITQIGDIAYDDQTGTITLAEAGNYAVEWFANTQGAYDNINFSIVTSQGETISGGSFLTQGRLCGIGCIIATEPGVTVHFVNDTNSEVYLPPKIPSTTDIAYFSFTIFNLDTNVLDGSAKGSSRTIGSLDDGDNYPATGNGCTPTGTYDLGVYAFAEGYQTAAAGQGSHAEGRATAAVGNFSHAEGAMTATVGNAAHSEGYFSCASDTAAHAEGSWTKASSQAAHAEGSNTVASAYYAHAEGDRTIASGISSHAQGTQTTASGLDATASGLNTQASGIASFAAGSNTQASGYGAVSFGGGTIASGDYQTAIGQGNVSDTVSAFIIGNSPAGQGQPASNALTVDWAGNLTSAGALSSGGADYAEMFEWADGNPANGDRIGYFVTVENGLIRKATKADPYVLGVTSATPSLIGDAQNLEWFGKFLKDEWGRPLMETAELLSPEGTAFPDPKYYERPILNPNYDDALTYVPRTKRLEWSAVGMIGKLKLHQDGTCQANGFCSPNDEGKATKSERGYFVLEVHSENIITVVLK